MSTIMILNDCVIHRNSSYNVFELSNLSTIVNNSNNDNNKNNHKIIIIIRTTVIIIILITFFNESNT